MIRQAIRSLGAAGAVVILVIAAADESQAGNARAAAGMYTTANLTKAIRSFRRHHGHAVGVLDLTVTSRSAFFTYLSDGRPARYEVDLPGPHPTEKGPTVLDSGVPPYSAATIRGDVPAALLARIIAEPGLAAFAPDDISLAPEGGRVPIWTVAGRTPRRVFIFTASAQGQRLRTVCSQPVPGPHHAIGC